MPCHKVGRDKREIAGNCAVKQHWVISSFALFSIILRLLWCFIIILWARHSIVDLWTHLWAIIMTSSNGDIFRVTGLLCLEFTSPGEFPTQRPVTQSFDVFFDLCLNKRLSEQSWGWWFEMPSCPLWRHRDVWMCSECRCYFIYLCIYSFIPY